MVKDRRGRRAAKLVRDGRGQVQEVTFSHSGGYWWAAVRLRVLPAAVPQPPKAPAARPHDVLGLDAGMGRTFATLDTAVPELTDETGKVRAPRHLRRAQAQLAEARRWLARTAPGSNRHRKALRRVQRLPGRVAARRDTFRHQLAIALAGQAHTFGVETLNLRGMARRTKGFRFGASVADNGWAGVLAVLARQAGRRGAVVVAAPRTFPSSKTCSGCGAVKAKLPLSERTNHCSTCGLVADRDVNAARNLAALARTGAPPGVRAAGGLALTA